MVKTIEEILSSKTYVKPNNSVRFPSPIELLHPFLDLMDKGDIKFEAKVAGVVINSNADNSENIAFERVNVQAILETPNSLYRRVVGFVYALDIQKPIMKVYAGFETVACTNLAVHFADRIFQMDLLGNTQVLYEKSKLYLDESHKEYEKFKLIEAQLRETELTQIQLNEAIGRMLRKSDRMGLGTTAVTQAAKFLDSPNSKYYVGEGEGYKCNLLNIHEALTQTVTNSNNILDRANKSLLISNLVLPQHNN